MTMCRKLVLFWLTLASSLCVASAWSDLQLESRIVGGTNATSGQCGHTVAIRLVGRDFHCNGVLISAQDVLTAAQCVYNGNSLRNASEFQVVLGTAINTNNTAGAVIRSVWSVWTNGYSASSRVPDIAVLRLSATVPTSTSINIARLGTNTPAVNRTCQLCGWGANSTVGRPAQTLQTIQLQVQPSNSPYCVRTAQAALLPDQLCAGDLQAGRGACNGDLGGPLVCDGALHGVLSLAGGCGALNETSIFANTATQAAWINNRTQQQVTNPGGGGGSGGGGGGGSAQIAVQIGMMVIAVSVALLLK